MELSSLSSQRVAVDGEQNGSMFDAWSYVHFASGFIMGVLGTPQAFLLLVGYECIEPIIEEKFPNVFPNPTRESDRNILGDIFIGCVGLICGTLARGYFK